jgi:biopolymer transport protein ExbB
VNTALGIATAAFALIGYNFYTNKIDNMTYAIDELGFATVSTFSATH